MSYSDRGGFETRTRPDPQAIKQRFQRAQDAVVARGAAGFAQGLGLKLIKSDARIYFIQPGMGSPAKGTDSCALFCDTGTWKDFNGGDGGDMIKLCQATYGLVEPMDALKEAEVWLGWRADAQGHKKSAEQIASEETKAREDAAKRSQAAEADRAKIIKSCRGQYLNMLDPAGTPVQTYLEARGIDFEVLGKVPGVIKYEPEARYYWGFGKERDQNDRPYDVRPAMVCAFYDFSGQIMGLHRTFLEPHGRAKATFKVPGQRKLMNAKKMRGQKQGCIIPIHKGTGDFGYSQAVRRKHSGVLAICEGIEDALTVAMACPDYRVWAAGDKGNMAAFEWPPIASGVVLVADNDGATVAEQEAAFSSVAAWWRERAKGRPLVIRRSAVGKDFNDWLKAD